ncbi:tyrosine-type recombinase/integrase [Paraburkholderia dipogonis]|uniref:tyrosine-type recombinase/integrase n=1 Tax=Paraburkholderia dipogonis TaxID=1211383 RepID=UPI0038BCDE0A
MAKQRINRELVRRLQDENRLKPKLREVYDDAITGFGVRITPKGTVSFLYRWTQPDGSQTRKTIAVMASEADVKKAREQVLEEIRRLDHIRDTPALRVLKHERRLADRKSNAMPTVGEFLDGDYREYWLGITRSETPEQNLKNIRRDFADLMDKRLDEVTRPMIKRWIEKRVAAKHKPTAINRTLGSIGGLFSHAVEHEKIDMNPCARLRQKIDPEETDKLGRELTVDEEQRLRDTLDARETAIRELAAAPGRRNARKLADLPGDYHTYVDHVKPAILLAINTGMRRSELLRLRWTSINWAARTLTVEPWTTKVKRRRVLPLNNEALSVLKAWRRQTKFEFVFTNEVGERLTAVRDWGRIRKVAKIEDFRFMDTRHHTATRMINEGVPEYHVQKILGHTDSRMTQRYLKAREAKLQEALAVLDRPRVSAQVAEAA